MEFHTASRVPERTEKSNFLGHYAQRNDCHASAQLFSIFRKTIRLTERIYRGWRGRDSLTQSSVLIKYIFLL